MTATIIHSLRYELRVPDMTATTIHSLRHERIDDRGGIIIDRRTEFGNEFVIGRDGDRETVIAKFEVAERARIAHDPVRRAKVKAMYGRHLFCWCAPERCHGNVYAKLAAELVNEGM